MEKAAEFAVLGLIMKAEETFEAIVIDLGKHAELTIGSIGDRFDFSLKSVGLLDSLVNELDFKDDDEKMNIGEQIGSYIGEVVTRNGLGEWISSSSEPDYPTERVAIVRTEISVFDPFNWALKRIYNGSEDDILLKFNLMVLNNYSSQLSENKRNETLIGPKKKKGFWSGLFEFP